jgi:DNA-binding LacI/PurR family transcriptional regulator
VSSAEFTRPVRLADVAARAGVSKKTASAVVNGVGQVRASTRDRVLSAIQELGYQPNPAARRLGAGRAGAVTLVLAGLGTGGAAALASAVFAAGERAGLVVLCEPTGGSAEREREVFRTGTGGTDGVLFVPTALELPAECDVPVVVIGDRSVSADVDQVVSPVERLARSAVDHLGGIGRTELRVVADAQRAGRLTEMPGSPVVAPTGSIEAGYAAVLGLLDRGSPALDGLVVTGESLALGAIHAIRTQGLRVPEDIAVVATGPTSDAAYSMPSLTTVEPDVDRMAAVALDFLLERIHGGERPARSVEIPGRLVERESTLGRY